MSNLRYFYFSFVLTFFCFILTGFLSWSMTPNWTILLGNLFTVFILGILEISLSFDNAIVNAATLKEMNALWRQRFLTWGILIAVFGMRFVFPVLIVTITAHLGPIEAITLAISNPNEYARIMIASHVVVNAYGGAFLLMVCLSYFFDEAKEIHWIHFLERRLTALGRLKSIELGISLVFIYFVSLVLGDADKLRFVVAAILGLITYVLVDAIGTYLKWSGEKLNDIGKASFGLFLYLEVLDASFSFDGVIGAFALSRNIFIIMIGLGIGALYVRSLTIMLVEKDTLTEFPFLEHGAFYAIGALAGTMMLGTIFHIPEVITGLIGAAFIIVALWSSIRVKGQK